MSSLFNLSGWEMVANLVRADQRKDADRIVAFVHWLLVQKAHMGCLGNGNDVGAKLHRSAPFRTRLTPSRRPSSRCG